MGQTEPYQPDVAERRKEKRRESRCCRPCALKEELKQAVSDKEEKGGASTEDRTKPRNKGRKEIKKDKEQTEIQSINPKKEESIQGGREGGRLPPEGSPTPLLPLCLPGCAPFPSLPFFLFFHFGPLSGLCRGRIAQVSQGKGKRNMKN